jgi:ethanolamine ammonia-lyase small subunit
LGAARVVATARLMPARNQILVPGIQTGADEVIIYLVFAGTPRKRNCHREVVSNLVKQYDGLDAAAAASSVLVLQNADGGRV